MKHNSQGRYEIPVNDTWIKGRIEYSHKDKDYYLIADDVEQVHGLTGIKARALN